MTHRALAQYDGMGDAIKLVVVPASLDFVANGHTCTRLAEQTTHRV